MSLFYKRKPIATTGTTPFAISDIVQQTNGGIKDLEDKRVESINSINNTKTNSINTINTTTQNNINNIKIEGANQIALATAQAELATQKAEEAVGVAIGTYLDIASNSTYTPSGYLLRDGAEYSKSQFENFYNNWLTNGTIKILTYADYNEQVRQYGFCDKFAVDTSNQKFKAPLASPVNRVLIEKKEPTESDPTWYNLYNDGWCEQGGIIPASATTITLLKAYGSDIYSILMSGSNYASSDQALGVSSYDNTSFKVNSSNYKRFWEAKGYTNQVVEGSTRPYVVVANGELNQSTMNWSQWATSLEGKLNTDHSNDTKPYITETYTNGSSGYRIWSDGYCEQWGNLKNGATLGAGKTWAPTVSLLVNYINTNYNIFLTYGYGTASDTPAGQEFTYSTKTNNSFLARLYNRNGSTTMSATIEFNWKTSGYIK